MPPPPKEKKLNKKTKEERFCFFKNPKISNLFVDDIDRNILSQSL
jgi:hypothetical protein